MPFTVPVRDGTINALIWLHVWSYSTCCICRSVGCWTVMTAQCESPWLVLGTWFVSEIYIKSPVYASCNCLSQFVKYQIFMFSFPDYNERTVGTMKRCMSCTEQANCSICYCYFDVKRVILMYFLSSLNIWAINKHLLRHNVWWKYIFFTGNIIYL